MLFSAMMFMHAFIFSSTAEESIVKISNLINYLISLFENIKFANNLMPTFHVNVAF